MTIFQWWSQCWLFHCLHWSVECCRERRPNRRPSSLKHNPAVFLHQFVPVFLRTLFHILFRSDQQFVKKIMNKAHLTKKWLEQQRTVGWSMSRALHSRGGFYLSRQLSLDRPPPFRLIHHQDERNTLSGLSSRKEASFHASPFVAWVSKVLVIIWNDFDICWCILNMSLFSVLCPKFPILPKNHYLEQQAANLLSETDPFKDDYQTMLLRAQTKHTGMVEEIL